MQKHDWVAKIVGLLVFALGIVILVFSFMKTYDMFTAPLGGIVLAPATGGQPTTTTLGSSALLIVLKIGLLFIMVLAGSRVAALGVRMYFAGDVPLRVSSNTEDN